MPNRLAGESSPYLLQHQDNPVDWYPWGAEALLKARAEEKPIFLSIGYSACHWCHVMEHESFENEQIAAFLNEHFISIKVDREERPDLDQIYMQAVMAMYGHGGWPLSAFLTPDQDFFFGGTYWPPTGRAQMPGFDHVLASVLDAFHNKRDQVVEQSRQITEMLNRSPDTAEAAGIDPAILQTAVKSLHNRFDSTYGGFGTAPKFPHPMDLTLLLNRYQQGVAGDDAESADPSASEMLEMVEVTLKKMAYGGIYDHLAGGFARYSVDARWLVPHFEKMLYDNALLAAVYLRAGQVTGNRFYHRIGEKTLEYLRQYMTDPAGAFYSTEDADSEGQEGKFYVWTVAEVVEVLGAERGRRFCQLYDVSESGNFEGQNILNLPRSYQEFADSSGIDKQELMDEMRQARRELLQVRDRRVRPGRDDKVITSWNALAIAAFSDAAIVLQNEDYAEAASRAADFVWENLRDDQGRLLHTWRNGQAKLPAYLDDYSYLINALVSLYRVAFEPRWIERARQLADTMIAQFSHESGAFCFTASDHEKLIARLVEFQDSAVPGGNSMAACGLLRLGRLTGQQDLLERAHRVMRASLPLLHRAPNAASQMLVAMDSWFHNQTVFVLLTGADESRDQAATRYLQQTVRLEDTLVVLNASGEGPASDPLAGIREGKTVQDGQPTLYICNEFGCQAPISGLGNIESAVQPPR